MTDRILTADEIMRLAREYQNLRQWEGVRDFVLALFGERAREATIHITSQYNDFRYDDQIEITVFDQQGQPLGYDWETFWWQQFPLRQTKHLPEEDHTENVVDLWVPEEMTSDAALSEEIRNAIQTLFAQTVGIELIENGTDHDPISLTFHLEKPPTVRYPVVYVVEP
jgi:hypothetical protein